MDQIHARVMLGLVFKWFRDPEGVVSCSPPPPKKQNPPPRNVSCFCSFIASRSARYAACKESHHMDTINWESVCHQRLQFSLWRDQMCPPMFQNTEPVRNFADRSSLPWHSSLLLVKLHFSGIFGLKLLQLPGLHDSGPPCENTANSKEFCTSSTIHDWEPTRMLQIPGALCPQWSCSPSCGAQSYMDCRGLGTERPNKVPERQSWNSIPIAVKQVPGNCAKDQSNVDAWNRKRTHSEMWAKRGAKRGWKRGRNGLESGIPGCMVWFWFFVGARPYARKHFMETD